MNRRRRGATLVVTVLLTVVTATIALFLTNLAVVSLRAEGSRAATEAAVSDLDAARADFEEALAGDPTFFLKRVHELEPPRVCLTGAIEAPIASGAPWPASCGTSWTYAELADPSTASVTITPPSSSSSLLVARFSQTVSGSDVAFEAGYRLGGRTQPLVFSGSDLDLGSLSAGSGSFALSGIIYAGGSLSPAAGSFSHAWVATEEGFTAPPSSAGATFLAPTAAGDVRAIRSVLPRFSASNLAAAADNLLAAACPGSTQTNVGGNLSSACFAAGETIIDVSGTPREVPANTARYLIVPNNNGTGKLDVWTSTSTASVSGVSCASACDYPALAAASANAGAHPGVAGYWTSLGRFNLPALGVATFDADVQVGLCGEAFLGGSGSCEEVVLSDGLTVVAGSRAKPADVYLGAPIRQAGGVLAVVATGSARIPYWGFSPGKQAAFEVSVVSLASGTSASVASWPQGTPATAAKASAIVLSGALLAPDLVVDIRSATSFSVTVPDGLRLAPWMPSTSRRFVRDYLHRLSADELAG